MTNVYINEKYVGEVDNAKEFLKFVKTERRLGNIPTELNLYFDEDFNEIYVDTTTGRARRPLIIVENGKSKLTEKHIEGLVSGEIKWKRLVKEGIIEYVDAAEEEDCFVAMDENELEKDHTHLEIGAITLLGICTSLIPYSNFGSLSRLIRGSKIQKQSLGLYASNFLLRMDTDVNVLHYPQRPIVKSFMGEIFDYDSHPCGQNITIAVMSYEGYNMDDSIILNKASVERGLARSTYFKPFNAEELRYQGGLVDEVGIPDPDIKGYRSEKEYRLLEDDGIVSSGSKVGSEDGNRLVQVRLREQRVPEVGDKFASRHGQKGIVSYLVPAADMPFSISGIVPDLLFSPHGIPGRMTISHLIEVIAGKVGALSGQYIDGTTFDSMPEKDIRKLLKEYGFREDGCETFYNGVSGEEFKARIYVGNIYYLKLKHMVANKIHARGMGKIQLLTRQPIEGRSQGGGLRVGEMEKDCFVAHGASLLLKERFDSDSTSLNNRD